MRGAIDGALAHGRWRNAGDGAPSPAGDSTCKEVGFEDDTYWLDGLVLHGGADVRPGKTPLQERWSGDRIRDQYKQSLLKAFVTASKPVFGVCRGQQLINVAFGSTLYQDIPMQRPQSQTHRDSEIYDQHFH